MRRNLLDCLKSKVLFLLSLYLLSASFVVGNTITVEDILNKSKSDPEFAWDMYLLYISSELSQKSLEWQDSDSQVKNSEFDIERLGKFLHAKRKLKKYEFAVKEDVIGLINFLNTNNPTEIMKFHIIEIFTEERLWNYLIDSMQRVPESILLLNIIDIYDSKLIVNNILKNSDEKYFNLLLSQIFPKLQNKDILLQELVKEIERFYLSAPEEDKKEKYESFYNVIKKHYPEYRLATLEKYKNNGNFRNILEFFGTLKIKILKLSRQSILSIIVLLGLIIIFSTFFASPFVQYTFFRLLGLRKKAVLSYKKVVEKDPLNEEKRFKLAQLYEEAGMYEEAMSEYNFIKRLKID